MEPWNVNWQNFRGFTDSTSLSFPAMTVLIGRNNVGKTSAYMPLLLMQQTLGAKDPETALLGRGPLVDAGPFREYVTDHDIARRVRFNVGLPIAATPPPAAKIGKIAAIDFEFESSDGQATKLYRQRVLDEDRKPIVTRTRENEGKSFLVNSRLLPTRSSVGRPLKEVSDLRRSMREEQPDGFIFSGFGSLVLPRAWRENRERWKGVQDWYNAGVELYTLQTLANDALVRQLNSIAYLGPIRSLPRRTYRLAAEAPASVGSSGEHAPELLFRHRDDSVLARVQEWLRRLGYGSLDFAELGQEYFQLQITAAAGVPVNMAHCGAGLAQLLPLLVQGVMLPKRGTLIAQQPEIHLNPAQQGIVADFLLELAREGRRIVVETHSEHVLLRIRRRMAENGQLAASDLAVYFFDSDDGHTKIERIEVGDQGEISTESWPHGFFEEQLADSFAMALAQSRR